jgi:hypothetical protein
MKLSGRLRKNPALARAAIGPLLGHPDSAVRLAAAVDALNLEIRPTEAEQVLASIAHDQSGRALQLMARINLDMWRKQKSPANAEQGSA